MKKLIPLSFLLLIASCQTGIKQEEYNKMMNEKDSIISAKDLLISQMHDSIVMYSYPADQRLIRINELISSESFAEARNEISQLIEIFPISSEASTGKTLLAKIQEIEAKKEAEIQRIKALGFKAVKAQTTVTVDYNTVTFSGISVGSRYTFDSYSDEYRYRGAERGWKYVTATMTVKSTDNYARIPMCQYYLIEGDKMRKSSWFETRFARWSSYGHYLGNYTDYKNDFAHTSTIAFKIGAEVHEDDLKKPGAIVMKHENVQRRNEDRHENPPVSYSSGLEFSYPDSLSIDDFSSGEYHVIKYYNF